MSSPTPSTFGLMQMDERYKKLERTLKVLMSKQSQPPWSNVSSINGDHLDTSITAMSHTSRFGSEVVASSSNMRGILPQKSKSNNNQHPTNVNSTPLPVNPDTKVLMPPPTSIGILAHSSRRNSLAGSSAVRINSKLSATQRLGNRDPLTPSVISSNPDSNSSNINSTAEFVKRPVDSRATMTSVEVPDRIFSKWRVMLNDKGQLIIKGTLECGKVARSKAVIRKLSITTVQSVYNHIYKLDGSLYDERNELPEYIRGKFFNGFPDDWENVYQVWRMYIAGGCNQNFRWPTPIADSDDDIQSEITETAARVKTTRRLRSSRNVMNNHVTTNYHDNVKLLTKSPEKTVGNSQIPTVDQSSKNKSTRDESMKNPDDDPKTGTSTNAIQVDMNKVQMQLNSSAPSTASRINVIPLKEVWQEDKLKLVMDTLASENCSVEYIDKFKQMFDCCTYLMSHKSEGDCDAESLRSKAGPTTSNSGVSEVDQISTKHKLENTKEDDETKTPLMLHSSQLQEGNQENKSAKRVNESYSSTRMKRVRRKLSSSDFDSSSYDSDSVVNKRSRSTRQVLLSREKRSRTRQSERERLEMMKKRKSTCTRDVNDCKDELKNITPSAPTHSELNDRFAGIKKTSPVQERPLNRGNTGLKHTEIPVKTEQQHEHHRYSRRSPSTIRGFLANYDSAVSITEDESKSQDKTNHAKFNKIQSQVQYDSSVSITEDEFVDMNSGLRTESKRQILQEANTRCLHQMATRKSIVMDNNPETPQNYERKIQETRETLQKLQEKRQYQRELQQKQINEKENKENRSNNDDEKNKNNLLRRKSRELPSIELKKSPVNQLSPEKKNKPTITSIETVSINLNTHLQHKSSSSLSSSDESHKPKENKKRSVARELSMAVQPKLLEDNKKSEKPVDSPATTKKKTDAVIKGKTLTVCLEDIETEIKVQKGLFGSETNPKRITAWVPKVLPKPDNTYGLIFEGKLLNEAGHILRRKHATGFVIKRINPTIIETENHIFYELVGDLCDSKRTVPKALTKQCFNKCPARISQFCEKWRNLIVKEECNITSTTVDVLNASVDIENMPTSSRGRRIMPPLCYWTGERVVLKDNQPVYNPGNSQDSLHLSSLELSRRESQNSSKRQDTSTKDSTVNSTKTSSKAVDNLPTAKINNKNDIIKMSPVIETERERRNSRRSTKRRLIKREKSASSSDSSEEQSPHLRSKRRKNIVNCSDHVANKSRRRTTLRASNKSPSMTIECKKVPYRENDLSDDEVSNF